MGKISRNVATVGPQPYQREVDPRETELVGRYAADLGMCIYAWNTMMSAVFFIFLGASLKTGTDPQLDWSKLRSDRARLDATAKRVRTSSFKPHVQDDAAWLIGHLLTAIVYRNAITHLGLNYVVGSVGADPYGQADQAAIVQSFLDRPGDLGSLIGDLRVLRQFGGEVGFQSMYSSMAAVEPRIARPELFFLTRREDPPEVPSSI